MTSIKEQIDQRNTQVLQALENAEPEYSECAHFAKRPLSWAAWVPGVSENRGTLIDRRNLEFSHEHLVFEQSGHNVGFGPDGLFGEDVSQHEYRYDDTCYDGRMIRKALTRLKSLGSYHFVRNNCQDFAAKVREAYGAVVKFK